MSGTHRRFASPDEVRGEWAPDLDLVALLDNLVEVGRDFPVVQQVDRELTLPSSRGEDAIE